MGIIIGVMLVSAILSLGAGIQGILAKQLEMLGTGVVAISPGKESQPFTALIGGQRFRKEDLLNLKNIEGVDMVTVHDMSVLGVDFNGEKESTLVHGSIWSSTKEIFESSMGVKIAEGRYPSNDSVAEAVLGITAAKELFSRRIRVGDEIIVKSKRFKVVGIFSEFGNRERDGSIFISLPMYGSITGITGVMQGLVRVKEGYSSELVSKQIEFELSKQNIVSEFIVITPEKIANLAGNVLTIIELFLVVLSMVSLVVGAVGIMNTMYTAILERTRQIGIMKAVGASGTSILLLFLIESGMIGLIGGIIGIMMGIGLAYLVGLGVASAGFEGMFSLASLDYLGFLVVLIITFITGIVSGILPARQAANMEPAEALRFG